MISPVTPDVGDVGVVIVAVPDTTDHIPVPTAGTFPASVDEVTLQRFWSGPALAAVGNSSTVITTSSVELAHEPFEMVHLKVAEDPITSPVTPDVGDEGVVTVAVPDTTDHVPVPTAGVLPANVVVVVLQRFWSEPAAVKVGNSYTVITTSSEEPVHEPFEIVHLIVTEDPITSPVTLEAGDEGVVIVAVPETTDHIPVPAVGVFPARMVAVVSQRSISVPALAVVGNSSVVITISSVELAHAPFEMAHLKITVSP